MNFRTITYFDVNNGPGLRHTLWVQGCSIRCEGCHNSELWDFNSGKKFTSFTLKRLLVACKDDKVEGLTICGGEPLDSKNLFVVTQICHIFKKYFPNKSIWVYTGMEIDKLYKFGWEHILVPPVYFLLKGIDVLVDGPFIKELKDSSLPFKGSSNQRIIDVQKSLETNKITLWKEP